MRKITLLLAVLLAAFSFGAKAQNLINYWDAYDPATSALLTGAGTEPNKWGWSTNPATALSNWGIVNGGGIRYADNVSGYATGRIFYIRWDGAVSTSGKYVFKLDSINTTQLSAGHSYVFTWSYAWNSNATAPTLTTRICTSRDGSTGALTPMAVTGTSAAISGTTATFPCSGTSKSMRTGTITFIPPTSGDYYISIASNTGSLCAIRDLSLVDNGVVTYISATPASLAFTPGTRVKTLNVLAGGISNDLTLTTNSANFTLSKSSLTVAEATTIGGANIDVTSVGTNDGKDTVYITDGTKVTKVPLSLTSSLTTNTRAFLCDQSTQDSLLLNVSGDLYSNIALSAPSGISLVKNADNTPISSISVADALAGVVVKAKWDKITNIVDQKITLTSGALKDSVMVIALKNNQISGWDADTLTAYSGAASSLEGAGWTGTDGSTLLDGAALSNLFNTTGMRIVTIASAAHSYLGKLQPFGRTAYFRNWGTAAGTYNAFNLVTNLNPSTTYIFRGVCGWHNNVNAPTVTIQANTAKGGLGTNLGSKTVLCSTKQVGVDFGFEFTTPAEAGPYYLVITSDQTGDCMISPDYLAIYPKNGVPTATTKLISNGMTVITGNGTLCVKNTANYVVYNIQGVKVATVQNNNGTTVVKLIPGIYIVKAGDAVKKVVIK